MNGKSQKQAVYAYLLKIQKKNLKNIFHLKR